MTQPLVDLRYPTESHGRIPAFNNVEEEATFWDTHDITDYLDESRPVRLRISPNFTSEYRFVVALDSDDWEALVRDAQEASTEPAMLAQTWLKERLNQAADAMATTRSRS